jgi:type IV secretory pathway component VirB8
MSASLLDKACNMIDRLWFVIGGLILVILALVGLLIALFPLKEVEPIYVEFSSSGSNFVTVRSARSSTSERRMLADISLRAYIVQRETVDQITEFERYECVLSMSNNRVSEVFRKLYIKQGNRQEQQDPDYSEPLARVDGFKRKILINSDIPINKRGKSLKHQVEFTTIDTIDDEDPKTKNWVALIEYRFTDRKISLKKLKESAGPDGAVCNPLSIQVIDYTLSPKD